MARKQLIDPDTGQLVEVDLEDDDLPVSDGSPQSKAFIRQRQEIARLKAENSSLLRTQQFAATGVDMADPRVLDFVKAYDGPMEIEKMQEAAAKRGYLVDVPADQVGPDGRAIAQPTTPTPTAGQVLTGDPAADLNSAIIAQRNAQAIAHAAMGAASEGLQPKGAEAIIAGYAGAAAQGGHNAGKKAVVDQMRALGVPIVES